MRVLVGATGGIAAFKAAHLVRRLRERGHEVRCILTRSAESFVTPLSLEVLSGHTVYREEYLHPGNGAEAPQEFRVDGTLVPCESGGRIGHGEHQ